MFLPRQEIIRSTLKSPCKYSRLGTFSFSSSSERSFLVKNCLKSIGLAFRLRTLLVAIVSAILTRFNNIYCACALKFADQKIYMRADANVAYFWPWGSCARVLNFPAHHFTRCWHFAKISDLLFRSFVGSALIMHNFSSMQRLHRFPPDVYAGARFKIDQDMENFWWFFFNFHINLDSSVSFSYLIRLNDFLWLLYLSLNRFAVIPMYSLISPSNDFTSALYTMELDRQLLLRGQSVRFLQLQFHQVRCNKTATARNVLIALLATTAYPIPLYTKPK